MATAAMDKKTEASFFGLLFEASASRRLTFSFGSCRCVVIVAEI